MRIYFKIEDSRLSAQKTCCVGAEDIFLVNFSNSFTRESFFYCPSTILNLKLDAGVSSALYQPPRIGVSGAGKNEECFTELEVSEMKRLSTTTLLNDLWLRVPLPC